VNCVGKSYAHNRLLPSTTKHPASHGRAHDFVCPTTKHLNYISSLSPKFVTTAFIPSTVILYDRRLLMAMNPSLQGGDTSATTRFHENDYTGGKHDTSGIILSNGGMVTITTSEYQYLVRRALQSKDFANSEFGLENCSSTVQDLEECSISWRVASRNFASPAFRYRRNCGYLSSYQR
jgi:hypothetical protein